MDSDAAVTALGALAQETRLSVFRRLVAAGSDGLPAGALAQALAIPPSNLTFHLHQLEAAGLIRSRRAGRQIIYRLEAEVMRSLMAFLIQDCCQGAPDLCLPGAPAQACCTPPAQARKRQPATAKRSTE